MNVFQKLKEFQNNLNGWIPGSEGETIFWDMIAQEAGELRQFAKKQATLEKRK